MSDREQRWDAFLSYGSANAAVARRVQRVLERYRSPGKRRLRVYRDETDIAGGELPAQLRRALAESACLVVCCSRAAAQSRWVGLEIDAFRELAPGRPILPVLVADEPPDNLPAQLRQSSLRWADLRTGWRLGLPRAQTRVELVRVIAAVAGLDFRSLLPLDRRRRRLMALRTALAVAAVLVAAAWIPVPHWTDATPEAPGVFQCDTLDDGIAYFLMNEPQATKNVVRVTRSALGPEPRDGRFDEVVPRGRLLSASVASAVNARCESPDAEWIGEPAAGTCLALRRSEEIDSYESFEGAVEAPLTDVTVAGGAPFVLQRMWRAPRLEAWQGYGSTLGPSAGLPVSAAGSEIWLGFPADQFTRGDLWVTRDGGREWRQVPDMTDVRSVRHLAIGVIAAARWRGELGFWRFRADDDWMRLDVPGKGDDIEICGETEGQPVLRADRTAFRRTRLPWWRTQLD